MPEIKGLPLFQLGLVLFPRERLPLHIFEPRYRAMVEDCLQAQRPFGILLYQDGKMAAVGCTARIQRVLQEYEDGRRDILVEGEERFRIETILRDQAYLTADVQMIEEQAEPVRTTSGNGSSPST
jgi:ATP-dependent Lon protease